MAKRRRVPPRRAAARPQEPSPPGQGRRIALVLLLASSVGFAIGVIVAALLPGGPLFSSQQARLALDADTHDALAAVADLDDADLVPARALAAALIVVEHADPAYKKRAEALLKTTRAEVRTQPEMLYARALWQRMPGAAEDGGLDKDLDQLEKAGPLSTWAALARALRAHQAGRRDDAIAYAQKAALAGPAPAHADVVLARMYAEKGDTAAAQAVLMRALGRHPSHAGLLVAAASIAVLEDAQEETDEERAQKLKKVKAERAKGERKRRAPPKPGEPRDEEPELTAALWHTPAEERALEQRAGLDVHDRALLAFVLQAFATARGDVDLAGALKDDVVAAGAPSLLAREAELLVADADLSTAEEVLAAARAEQPSDVDLKIAEARIQLLLLRQTAEELRRRTTRALGKDGLTLPIGSAAIDVGAPVPIVLQIDPALSPEVSLRRAAGLSGSALDDELALLTLRKQAAIALEKGDTSAARDALARAKEKSKAQDPDLLLLEARTALRGGDRDAARLSLEAAIAAAPEDPHVLVTAAVLHYDAESYIQARKALAKLRALGIKSPRALAIEAMLEARANDLAGARQALAEAQQIGEGEVELLRAAVLVAREERDLDETRRHADRLLTVDETRCTDPVIRAWLADALIRRGDLPRAGALIDDVLAQRPALADAHLVKGNVLSIGDPKGAGAEYMKTMQLAPGTPVAVEALRRKIGLGAAGKAGPVDKKLPKKKPPG